MADPNSTLIRVAGAPDVDVVWQLLAACRSTLSASGIAQWDDVYPTRDTVRADVAAGRLFIVTGADRCLGAVTLDGNPEASYASLAWSYADPALIVHRLCVAPDMQGKGFGRQLMDFAERHAMANGWGSIRLDAYSGNAAAVDLYRRRGYRQVGELFFPRRVLPFYLFEWAARLHDRGAK